MSSLSPQRVVCTTCDDETEQVDDRGLPQCDGCYRWFRWANWAAETGENQKEKDHDD